MIIVKEVKYKIVNVLAYNLKRKRKVLGLTQEELADKANLHRTYIGAIERGERNITIKSLSLLARALKAKEYELLLKDGK